MTGQLVAVSVVHGLLQGPTRTTAIDKRPVDGWVEVTAAGMTGDTQCDTRHHGGPDKAVYAYAVEDAAWWAGKLGHELPAGQFGENLTTSGVDVTGAVIGERWRLGARRTGCVVEVTMPRTPCPNLSFRMGIPRFHRRFAASGRTGAYLRVVSGGRIRAGSRAVVEHRPDHGVTIGELASGASSAAWARLLDSDVELAAVVRGLARRSLDRS